MSNGKAKSRNRLQEKSRQNKSTNPRVIVAGLVLLGTLLVAFALIKSNLDAAAPAASVTVPTTVARPAGDGLTLGDPKAPVKIDVFEDFQCPACKQFTESVEQQVLSELVSTGKAYYVFHNYAFIDRNSTTQESHRAAQASLCANEQGKFWEYHDTLFANWNGENQGSFSDARLVDFATSLKLDVNAFKTCLSENRYADQVQASFDEGNTMGVQGTPSVFVNGTIVTPGMIPSYDDIAAAVEAAQP